MKVHFMVPSTEDQKLNICRNIIRGLWPKPMHKGRDLQDKKKKMCYKQFLNDCFKNKPEL